MHQLSVCIGNHTTSSSPRPHVLYVLRVKSVQPAGEVNEYEVLRRYSEFCILKGSLKDSYALPPKHSFAHVVIPSTWIGNEVIAERKAGLSAYLNSLIHNETLAKHPLFFRFLTPGPFLEGEADANIAEVGHHPDPISQSLRTELFPDPVTAAYYPSWAYYALPPNNIDFTKFDIIFYAFVTPTASADIHWDPGSEEMLRQLVLSARQSSHNTKIVLSVGGWGGSYWFSQAMGSAVNRAKLMNALVGAIDIYGLDGIDIDWEYPNSPGAGNPYSPHDAANLLSFLTLLRAALGPLKIISAAVAHLPWLGLNGHPLINVSQYAAVMTYVNIMNYDVFGASATPGPNAPLGNLCGSSRQPAATAQAALLQWTNAGMPASKLLLGLPLYGYVSRSAATTLSGSSTKEYNFNLHPHPNHLATEEFEFEHTGNQGDLSGMWGQQVAFKQLLSSGALKKMADGTYTGTNGFTMGWDDCSDTPYLFSVPKTTVVTYDDTWSLGSKVQFARQSGMAGCFTWSLDQDDGFALQSAIFSKMGRK